MSEDNDWYKRWKKMVPFGPWSFPDVDEMMKEMEKEFMQFSDLENLVPKDLVREQRSPDGSVKRRIGPIVYGYSMTVGPDGKPVIREFGNVKRGAMTPWTGLTDKREPLVDIVNGDTEVKVIAEVPGVNKEDIEVIAQEQSVTISVDTPSRKYYKQLQLPESVQPDQAKSSFNNGILEITMPKESGSGRGVRLKVE